MKNKFLVFSLIILSFFTFIALILSPLQKKHPQVIKRRPAVVKKIKTGAPPKGKIAIVIDDWGYNTDNLALAKEIKQPLTCAVLPNLNNSNTVAKDLNRMGFEVILHLPMQPKENDNLENNTINLSMDAKRISNIVSSDLASVKFARGVSNHMGSAITENRQSSSLVLTEVKKHKLYFLDSFVTIDSVCQEIAKRMKLRFAKRDVFLDNESDPEYIKAQLMKLKELSRQQESAIGIGHDRKTTLAVLKEILPQLEKQGYKFVLVSEVAK